MDSRSCPGLALTHPALLKEPQQATEMLEAAGFPGHKRGTGLQRWDDRTP
jgi:hypothetical protein